MEGINKNISMSYVWKKISALRNRKCVVNWNEWKDRNRAEEIKKEVGKIGRDWVREKDITIPIGEDLKEKNRRLNREFSEEELDRVIRGVRTRSAPGKDRIDYEMIKELPIKFKREILEIYNIFWKEEVMPDSWKEYIVFFIDKKEKQKVRPIALASCMGKIMERLVNERLGWWLEKEKILDEKQNGFRKGRGCNNNLIELITDIRNSMYYGKKVMAVFLDISSAYNNVQRNIMVEQLVEEKCSEKIVKFINKCLEGRVTKFIVGEVSEE